MVSVMQGMGISIVAFLGVVYLIVAIDYLINKDIIMEPRVHEEDLGVGESGRRFRTSSTTGSITTKSGRRQRINEDVCIEEVLDDSSGSGGCGAARCSRACSERPRLLGAGYMLLALVVTAVAAAMALSAPTGASERPTCAAPTAATARGIASTEATVQIRIRVHILQSTAHSDLNAEVTEADVREWIQGAAQIWAQAGIEPVVQSIAFEQARNGATYAFQRNTIAQGGARRRRGLADLRPLPPGQSESTTNEQADAILEAQYQASGGGWDMYVLQDFKLCGLALTGSARSRGSFFVKAKACSSNVMLDAEGTGIGAGTISTQAVTVAHEIGHCLSLLHKADNCLLMSGFIRGLQIEPAERAAARDIAKSGKGFVGGDKR